MIPRDSFFYLAILLPPTQFRFNLTYAEGGDLIIPAFSKEKYGTCIINFVPKSVRGPSVRPSRFLSLYLPLKDKDYCPIEIIKGLTDKERFQYLTKLMGPQEGTYLYATQFHSLR